MLRMTNDNKANKKASVPQAKAKDTKKQNKTS